MLNGKNTVFGWEFEDFYPIPTKLYNENDVDYLSLSVKPLNSQKPVPETVPLS
ncbi:MAG: hypothetical protein JXB88_10915 [Spirochaetales bacterium]|nr:hypothetical protein [Spirochaetales bacterium]